MSRLNQIILSGLVLLLAGCTTMTTSPEVEKQIQEGNFQIDGRFSLKQEDQAAHGRFEWQHDQDNNLIMLSGPTGQGVAEFDCNTRRCRMETADGKVRESASSAELMRSLIGIAFPIERIIGWLQGRSEGADRVERDSEQRLTKLWRSGWRVDYEYQNEARLPWLLIVSDGGETELKMRIESWSSLGALPEEKPAAASSVSPDDNATYNRPAPITDSRLYSEPDYR